MKSYVGQLRSVFQNTHDNPHDYPYTVEVTFTHNIIHGNVEQTMTFQQKKWPTSLSGYLNIPKEEMPPVFINCDLEMVEIEYQEIRDGREEFTVIAGFDGTPKVLGFYSRPIRYKVAYHLKSKQIAFFPIQPRSYRVLDGRIKHYATVKSRTYNQGTLVDDHILGVKSSANLWNFIPKNFKKKTPSSNQRNRLLDTYVLKCIRDELENQVSTLNHDRSLHTFEIEIDLSRCKDLYTLKELVRQTFLKRMTLDRLGIWNLLFLQPALHALFKVKAIHWFGDSFQSNPKHEFFESGDRLTASIVDLPFASSTSSTHSSTDSSTQSSMSAGTSSLDPLFESPSVVIRARTVDWDDPQDLQRVVDSWSDDFEPFESLDDDLSSFFGSLDYTFIEGHYISGYEALTEEDKAKQKLNDPLLNHHCSNDPLLNHEYNSIQKKQEEKRLRELNFLIENPSFGGTFLAVPIGFEVFSEWYRHEQDQLPKHGTLEFRYFEICRDRMIEYYRDLGYEFTHKWFEFPHDPFPQNDQVKKELRNALMTEFLHKINRGELSLPFLEKPDH